MREESLVPGPNLLAASENPEYLHLARTLGIRSILIVPMVLSEKAIGAIMLASEDPHRFEASDVERAQQLAHCFALALENARMYREARRAIAIREDFVAVAAHELRTPLTALELSLTSLAKARCAGDNPAAVRRWRAPRPKRRRLSSLSEMLLDVATFAFGHVILNLHDLDLRELVTRCAGAHREEAMRAGCTIELAEGAPVVVRCDRSRMTQILGNLLSNAIKFGHGHPIELAVYTTQGMARVIVTDHGIGIAGQDTTRILHRFERAASPQHYGGLGLGLYLAHEIVDAHGGSIAVSSRPGEGATFTVSLPMPASVR